MSCFGATLEDATVFTPTKQNTPMNKRKNVQKDNEPSKYQKLETFTEEESSSSKSSPRTASPSQEAQKKEETHVYNEPPLEHWLENGEKCTNTPFNSFSY